MIHPIGISIPAEKIVDTVPPKTKLVSGAIPNSTQSYTFQHEAEYYDECRRSCFAYTSKKGGWDCLRHYEIMANGCIPLFTDIDQCPASTMTHFPKELVREANTALITDLSRYKEYATRILDFTRTHLTTTAQVDSLLQTSGHANAKRVLFLSGTNWWAQFPDYVRNFTLHGLKKRLGADCHDWPRLHHIYTDFEGDCGEFHGRGFTATKLLDPSLRTPHLDDTIEADIRSHRYDVIVYGSVHRIMPFLELVLSSYAPSDVIGICGEDIHGEGDCPLAWLVERGVTSFRREMSTS
jgi:hypothetical protein